jgi:cellulose synthase (UDP-forming)
MGAYVGQQLRWARGCLSALPRVLVSRLGVVARLQYLLASMFFLTGWTILVYMSMPIVRILTGEQPIAAASGDAFLVHFAPYFAFALLAVAVAGAGSYTYRAFALLSASFWVHIYALVALLLRLPSRFVVTPKQGRSARQPLVVAPALLMAGVLVGCGAYGLLTDPSPATLNNVAFVSVHTFVLLSGAWPALARPAPAPAQRSRQRSKTRPVRAP